MLGTITGEKDEVDPITMMLYHIHTQLNFREVTTLSAIANVPPDLRYNIEDGIDLFSYLTDEDKIHSDYLYMLFTSIRRPDLVDHVQRFYKSEWKQSAYAHTMETFRKTGEILLVPRSQYKTVGITEEHDYDIYLHYTDADKKFAEYLIQLLKEEGVTILSGDFKEIWTEEPLRCRYCVPILSKSYIQQDLTTELNILLDQEINPGASLKNIIPILNGVTPKYLSDTSPGLESVAQFSFIGGVGEYIKQITSIIHNRLKTSVSRWYKCAVTLQCTSKHQSGKSQTFEVSMSDQDSFIVCRSENSVLFRGDKGIKGLREGSENGHCVISTDYSEECGLCVSVKSMGHPLTFVSVIAPIYMPRGTSTLLLGKEWISIASRRNASQCMAKIRISYAPEEDEGLVMKVLSPSVKEEVLFNSSVTIGSGEGSNFKIQVPGIEISKQHLKLTKTGEGWLLKPMSPSCHVYLQLPKEEDSEPVCVPSGGEILVGTLSTIRAVINEEEIPEDEGIGLSDTCSRISAKNT